ncbi:MAG: imidazolonepropionase [Robiginitalea sp.]
MQQTPTHKDASYLFIGPFTQLLTMEGLPLKGSLRDSQLPVIPNAGILARNGWIERVGEYSLLREEAQKIGAATYDIQGPAVGLPGLIDAHTHSCFAGSRARDYALRNSGSTYLEIAEAGGGIWETVQQTREATPDTLEALLLERIDTFLQSGITTLEVKSGYGLSTRSELKMLRVIRSVAGRTAMDLIPTCLAAHTLPRDFKGSKREYLEQVLEELLPVIREEGLADRLDAFVEQSAFSPEEITPYLRAAKAMGFKLTLHADQFTRGGSKVAIQCGAVSADHLEASGPEEIEALSQSDVVATALPGASIGLGCDFTPARALLDAGACLAIASDFNPGSAPMGDLLTQAALLGTFQKLTNAEVLAGITYRAAKALDLSDRGRLLPGTKADLTVFPADHFNEILYHQGQLRPSHVWKDGECILDQSR